MQWSLRVLDFSTFSYYLWIVNAGMYNTIKHTFLSFIIKPSKYPQYSDGFFYVVHEHEKLIYWAWKVMITCMKNIFDAHHFFIHRRWILIHRRWIYIQRRWIYNYRRRIRNYSSSTRFFMHVIMIFYEEQFFFSWATETRAFGNLKI